MVRRRAIDYYRAAKRRTPLTEEIISGLTFSESPEKATDKLHRLLQKTNLSEKMCAYIDLRCKGWEDREVIAEELGLTLNQVKYLQRKVFKKLIQLK